MSGTNLQLGALAPELVILAVAVLLLMGGAYQKPEHGRTYALMGLVGMGISMLALLWMPGGEPLALMNGLVEVNYYTQVVKAIVLLGAAAALGLSLPWLGREDGPKFEYTVLVLLATLGMMLVVSSDHLLAVYVALELANLAQYVLASIKRDSSRVTEAGLKYFILGSLGSGLFLFGASLVYGFTGALQFDALTLALTANPNVGAMVGLVLILVAFFFKVSAVPFHMWTPDVYEGAPTPVVAYFAIVPKVATLALLARLLAEPFLPLINDWQPIVILVSVASMAVGSFGALAQHNIKRLLAYSSIGHMGYALIGLAAGTTSGIQGLLVYLVIYLFMTAGTFGCVLAMQRKGEATESVESLSGLSKYRPYLAFALAVFMFSMTGIPPLAGFFSKFYIFFAALDAGLVWLAVLGVLFSVVSAFYYLRIVKLMYFDEADIPLDMVRSSALTSVITLGAVVTLFYVVLPTPLIKAAALAAGAVLP